MFQEGAMCGYREMCCMELRSSEKWGWGQGCWEGNRSAVRDRACQPMSAGRGLGLWLKLKRMKTGLMDLVPWVSSNERSLVTEAFTP